MLMAHCSHAASSALEHVLRAEELSILLCSFIGVGGCLRLDSTKKCISEGLACDALWQTLAIHRLPKWQRSRIGTAADLACTELGLPHRCWPGAASASDIASLQSLAVILEVTVPTWREALLCGPAFTFHRCTPSGAYISASGFCLHVLRDARRQIAPRANYDDICAYGNLRASSGLLYWEVWFDAPTDCLLGPAQGMYVGVVHDAAQPLAATDGADGYCYFSGGTCLSRNQSVFRMDRYGQGDAVGVLLDCERRELTFFKNRVNLGVVFRDLPLPLTPAVQVESSSNCQVQLGRPWRPSREEAEAALARMPLGTIVRADRRADWQSHELVW